MGMRNFSPSEQVFPVHPDKLADRSFEVDHRKLGRVTIHPAVSEVLERKRGCLSEAAVCKDSLRVLAVVLLPPGSHQARRLDPDCSG